MIHLLPKPLKKKLRLFLVRNDWLFSSLYNFSGVALRRIHREWDARPWSNSELRRWAPLAQGDVINVSGWKDLDKQGGRYRDYFNARSSYTVSNHTGAAGYTEGLDVPQISLDLSRKLPSELEQKFDCVFNHTTLEHVYEIHRAVENLCRLSRDLVIVVVPFIQVVHTEEQSFLDYWRTTPYALQRLFEENGLKAIYLSTNDNPVYNNYIFCVATRRPDHWLAEMRRHSIEPTEAVPGRCFNDLKTPAK